jgi:hypothetical protein
MPRDRIDVVSIKWFCRHEPDERSRVDGLLEVLRAHLPKALPKSYVSPTDKGTFSWSERFMFRNSALQGSVHWRCAYPFFTGSIWGIRSPLEAGDAFVTITVDFDYLALANSKISELIYDGTNKIADAIRPFYAFGLWHPDMFLVGGGPSFDAESKFSDPRLIDQMGWMGLPDDGVLFEWFGNEYINILDASIREYGTPSSIGVLMKYSNDKARRDLIPTDLLIGSRSDGCAVVIPPGVESR